MSESYPKLIAFVGKMGHGKTTCAKYLEDVRGYERVSVADPLRYMFYNLLRDAGVDYAECEAAVFGTNAQKGAVIPELGVSYRDLAQKMGEAGRQAHPDFWVNIWKLSLTEGWADEPHGKFVEDSCRHPNEARAVRDLGGIVVRVVRPGFEGVGDNAHVSETAQAEIEVDATIVNDGSIEDLEAKIDALLLGAC